MRIKLAVVLAVGLVLVFPSVISHVAPGPYSTAANAEQHLSSGQVSTTAIEGSPQEPLPRDFEEKARRRFEQIAEPELTFEQYLEFEKDEFRRQRQLEKDPRLRYQTATRKSLSGVPHEIAACENGDFETGLDTTKWRGAYGTVPANGSPVFSSFTVGIIPGNSPGLITNSNSRQTWVSAGPDPNVSIQRTGPNASGQPSAGAVRIGNAVSGSGSELLSKTFTVNSRQIRFWYAVVFHRTLHPVHQVPSFWVRVTDTSGNVIPGLVNLGNGRDKVIGDVATDPFLKNKGNTHLYTDWACAQINFPRTLVGKVVTIEFVTEDCAQFGHYGYAYIDNFCGNCPALPR